MLVCWPARPSGPEAGFGSWQVAQVAVAEPPALTVADRPVAVWVVSL